MIRQLTLLCMLSTAASGFYLYTAKHKAEVLDREIARNIRAAEAARERTGMLSAEWALVNEPQRLGDLADKYLALKPMAPTQFVAANDLPAHLPPVMSAADARATEATDDDAAPVTADAPPTDAAQPAAMASDANPVAPPADPGILPLPPTAPATPQVVAEAKPDPDKAAKPVMKVAAKTAPRRPSHPVAVASHDSAPMHDGPLTRGSPLPLAAPPPMRPQVMQAMAHPSLGGAHPAVMSAVPHFLGQSAYAGSALVHAGTLPPPMPLAPGAQ